MRPGREMCIVARGPFVPMASLTIWMGRLCPMWMRAFCGMDSIVSCGRPSPMYRKAFFPVPMSTKAACMPGRTFCTRPL